MMDERFVDELQEMERAILRAMDYAVPEEEREAAEDLVEVYRDDRIGLMLLHEFYSFLPESQETSVHEIRLVNRQRGIFLVALVTSKGAYLYLASSEGIEFHGQATEGYLADELLDFFGYESAAAFGAACQDLDRLPLYEPLRQDEDICPACHAASGELHELGCPVEICPWCGGQLIHCDCRYEQTGLESIETEEELVRFELLLEERGRIPYSREQRPAFLDDGPNVVFE